MVAGAGRSRERGGSTAAGSGSSGCSPAFPTGRRSTSHSSSKPFEHIAFVYFDALGWQLVNAMPGTRSSMVPGRDGLFTQLTAQFSVDHHRAGEQFHSGLTVAEHGLYEWRVYEPTFNRLIAPAPVLVRRRRHGRARSFGRIDPDAHPSGVDLSAPGGGGGGEQRQCCPRRSRTLRRTSPCSAVRKSVRSRRFKGRTRSRIQGTRRGERATPTSISTSSTPSCTRSDPMIRSSTPAQDWCWMRSPEQHSTGNARAPHRRPRHVAGRARPERSTSTSSGGAGRAPGDRRRQQAARTAGYAAISFSTFTKGHVAEVCAELGERLDGVGRRRASRRARGRGHFAEPSRRLRGGLRTRRPSPLRRGGVLARAGPLRATGPRPRGGLSPQEMEIPAPRLGCLSAVGDSATG